MWSALLPTWLAVWWRLWDGVRGLTSSGDQCYLVRDLFFRGVQDVTYHAPVDGSLAGGIYELIQAPQGKDGSATDVMSSAKLKVQGEGMYVHNTM